VTNIQNAYMMLLRMAMRAPISLVTAMFMSFVISPRIASIYLVAVVFLSIVLMLIMNRATRYFKQVFERYDDLNQSVQENVTAIRVVKAFVREEYEKKKFNKAAMNIYNMFVKAEGNIVYTSPVMMATVYTCIMLISWIGAHMIVAGDLTTGALMTLLTYCMNILMSLMMLSMIFVMMTMSAASARRISEVLNEEPSLKNPENPVMEVKDGSIDFEDVYFSYKADATEMVLKDINIHIKSGESIGIIGGTGSAKSSLVNLISRLYDVTRGTLKVGGVDVRDYDMEVLRDQVSVVLQKNVLFSGTIYDNLRWGNPDATDEECREACRMACADEFIDRMPDGYDTYIEQGGANVSGGQKQRLCIARALLKKPRVLILDDSTSACDTATDAKIHHAFDTMIPDTTKLVIAQRVSSVEHCDRILVMENGRVDAFDTPENLLKTNAIYREVYESQTGGNGDFDQ
jgi:ATP-binding cassette subfamily B protein